MKPDSERTTVSKGKIRKSLHLLQPSATDKETLVGAGRILRSSQQSKEVKSKSDVTTKNEFPKSKISTADKFVQTEQVDKIKIEAEDLTSTAGQSENYWQIIAERRRIALEDTLEENKELTQRIERLQEENEMYKKMLDETKTLIEVLQDMIGDDRNDINNSLDDSTL